MGVSSSAMSGEPAAKKAKVEASMNVNGAVDKAHEGQSFKQLCELPPSSLQGMADWTDETCRKLGIKTVRDLGTWKYFLWAQAMVELAAAETDGKRENGSGMNLNKSLAEIISLPPSALQGIAEHSDSELGALHVKTIEALGKWKYARAAAIVTAAE